MPLREQGVPAPKGQQERLIQGLVEYHPSRIEWRDSKTYHKIPVIV